MTAHDGYEPVRRFLQSQGRTDIMNCDEMPSGLQILARQLPLMDDLRKLGIRYEPDYPGRAENDRELIRLGVDSEATIRERRNACRNN